VAKRSWEVELQPACEAWANDLPQADAEALLAAIMVLRAEGPNLGRPLVDRIKGSRHANMKELRPGSMGRTEVRVLFAFDKRFDSTPGMGGVVATPIGRCFGRLKARAWSTVRVDPTTCPVAGSRR